MRPHPLLRLATGALLLGAVHLGCSSDSNGTDAGPSVDVGNATTDGASDRPVPQDVPTLTDVTPDASDAGPVDTGPAPDVPMSESAMAMQCTSSGGVLASSLCCASASDFPNLCAAGACGCAPTSSHMIVVCRCPSGLCWNGSSCSSGGGGGF